MVDLVIDTCVLVDASHKGDAARAAESIALLKEFESNTNLNLAVDQNGFVLKEYDDNINASMYASYWLKQFGCRLLKFPVTPLPRGLRVKLDEVHFSVKDRRFVQVAILTGARLLVTREPDYSIAVCGILRNHADIRVVNAAEALACVRVIAEQQHCGPA